MNNLRKSHLLAEKKYLEELLAELPDSAEITKMSTRSKIANIDEQLEFESIEKYDSSKVSLTFKGKPVVDSYGIFAEFAMKAVSSFTDAVAAMAASLAGPLSQKGPIANKDNHQLIITNTAIGSFGFELEEHIPENSNGILESSPISIALERTQNLLFGSIGTDDQLAESASETDPRALEKIRNFLEVLSSNEAICEVRFRDTSFKFGDISQVRTSIERLSNENLLEEERILIGQLIGVLPKSRTFEFLVAENQELIRGKISKSIEDAASLNSVLNKNTKLRFNVTQVGKGKPRYVIIEVEKIELTNF